MNKILFILFFIPVFISAQNIKVSLPCVPVPAKGGKVIVPVKAEGFKDIGAITLKIKYDPAVLKFDSTGRKDEFFSGAAEGVLSIARAALTPVSLQKGKLLDIYFTFLGGESKLKFADECELASLSKGVVPAKYNNGIVTDSCGTIKIGIITPSGSNTDISVPVMVSNFNNIGSVTSRIAYNPDVLRFNSVSDEFFAGAAGR